MKRQTVFQYNIGKMGTKHNNVIGVKLSLPVADPAFFRRSSNHRRPVIWPKRLIIKKRNGHRWGWGFPKFCTDHSLGVEIHDIYPIPFSFQYRIGCGWRGGVFTFFTCTFQAFLLELHFSCTLNILAING